MEELASVLQDLAASGIYDEVLVRSACAASAYRLADSSSAALVKLTAAMASFKHPDGRSVYIKSVTMPRAVKALLSPTEICSTSTA